MIKKYLITVINSKEATFNILTGIHRNFNKYLYKVSSILDLCVKISHWLMHCDEERRGFT